MENRLVRRYVREYKGFHITALGSEINPDPQLYSECIEVHFGDIDTANLPTGLNVPSCIYSDRYDVKEFTSLNKAIEMAKEWIDSLQRCRKCGCTQYDCRQCIEKTGSPCTWAEKDLCSACVEEPEIPVVDTRASQSEAVEAVEAPEEQTHETALAPAFVGAPTNFFTQLAASGKKDFTLRVVHVKDRLTVGVFPGPGKKGVVPANFTMDPAELDEQFFTSIISKLEEQMKPLPANEKEDDDSEQEEKPNPKPKKKPAPKKKAPAKPKARPVKEKKKAPVKPDKKTKPAKPKKELARVATLFD